MEALTTPRQIFLSPSQLGFGPKHSIPENLHTGIFDVLSELK